jgi:penicillin-binding protein 1C
VRGVALALGFAAVVTLAVCSRTSVPSFKTVQASYRSSDLIVRGRDGSVIQEVRVSNEVRRFQWISLSAIPVSFREAVVFAEDRRFYAHSGIDWRALARAILRGGRGGASTLTMQLGGLLEPALRPVGGGKRSYLQKINQLRFAWSLEKSWTKEQILEAYLNLVPFRGEVEGVSGAARALLGKEVGGISPDEGVALAVLLRSPNAASSAIAERACRLKEALVREGDRSFALAGCERLGEIAAVIGAGGVPQAQLHRVVAAPHVGRLIAERAGEARDVLTTLDPPLQRFVSEQLRAQLAVLAPSHVADGAALVVRNDTGEVLAYVGNGGAESSARFVDGVRARRQAGSTLKPFLYALALERRLLAADTLLNDAPVDIPVGNGVYRPKNYDNLYRGPVSVRVALAASLNIPAVLTVQRVGVGAFVEFLGKLGFGALQSADLYGPSAALGSPTVSLWELVSAYRTLAHGGSRADIFFDPRIAPAPAEALLSAEVAYIIGDILADRGSRSPTFGLENALGTSFWSAAKTGTSKDMTDNWCLGFTRDYTVGVWVGNFSGEPMHNVSGVTGAAPLWARILDFLAQRPGFNPAAPVVPPGVTVRESVAGQEFYLPGTESREVVRAIRPEQRPATIVRPVDGSIIAIDPDIPVEVQKIPFESSGAFSDAKWVLNGEVLADVSGPYLWSPVPGKHVLELRRYEGTSLMKVQFLVKGSGTLDGGTGAPPADPSQPLTETTPTVD